MPFILCWSTSIEIGTNLFSWETKLTNSKESRFTSDVFLPYLSPPCPCYACNNTQRRSFNPSASAFSNYQKPRYSMPIPAPVSYQIVPIRHSNSYYRAPTKSLQNLNTFGTYRGENRGSIDDNNNSSRYGTLRNADERRSPYYYNELTRTHATNQQHFLPINSSPIHFNSTAATDESFVDFINTIHAENTSWAPLCVVSSVALQCDSCLVYWIRLIHY